CHMESLRDSIVGAQRSSDRVALCNLSGVTGSFLALVHEILRWPSWSIPDATEHVTRQASRPARIPVRNTPSNVPAPPIESIGAPSFAPRPRLSRSAPLSVPLVPPP